MAAPPDALLQRFPDHTWSSVTDGLSGALVWRLHGPSELFVKVAGASPHLDSGFDVRAEVERTRWLAGRGIPVPEVVDAGTTGAEHWLITTAVAGLPAAHAWSAEQVPAVVDALADLTRTLHALPVEACPFDRSLSVTASAARHAARAGLLDLDDLDDERAGWTAEELLAELEATRPDDEDLVVCHGDLTFDNVLLDPATATVTGLIDLGRLGRADRCADLALLTGELAGTNWPGAVERFLHRYGGPAPDPARLAFYRLLDEFF
ncbi:APH(3') family aminoglycoside O-phosphotransferase [Pseudonocardia humida]|uniref:Aminoglycoside 3'-phosphotransferase n=1 Tax=Pseudonocardia humida TaxID=2800819 RepID=A0ABT0ZY28_9PSEU|nr:APH(3') family aminoglycoside O-phosphotransferase [Pseudonocardia humida]MCO1655645.1 aminoglycoside 3'-phosphotransferase [Pseudonocardia humida]